MTLCVWKESQSSVAFQSIEPGDGELLEVEGLEELIDDVGTLIRPGTAPFVPDGYEVDFTVIKYDYYLE